MMTIIATALILHSKSYFVGWCYSLDPGGMGKNYVIQAPDRELPKMCHPILKFRYDTD